MLLHALLVTCLLGCAEPPAVLAEVAQHADATCACDAFQCTTNHVRAVNRLSVSDERRALSPEHNATFAGHAFRAAECQAGLRSSQRKTKGKGRGKR